MATLLAASLATNAAAADLTGLPAGGSPTAPAEHRRPADQTFLTYPEWFLVFSPAEYAAFVKEKDPSDFPFLGHIGQFWESYRAVWRITRARYPFNAGYHLMIVVIGVSTTVEYALRAVYEALFGRFAERARGQVFTAEDRYGAAVAQDYVDFIRVRPWYEYDFLSKLRGLWKCPSTGTGFIRKWERRWALTSEYAAKALYGWLLGKMTKATYEEPLPVTAVVLDRLPPPEARRAELKVLEERADGALITIPRYEPFLAHALALAREGVAFREVAGNSDVILVSALVPAGTAAPAGELLFRQRILTVPGVERVALSVPISQLAPTLVALDRSPSRVEHVFDF